MIRRLGTSPRHRVDPLQVAWAPLVAVAQQALPDAAALRRRRDEVVAAGGEGWCRTAAGVLRFAAFVRVREPGL